MTPPRFFAASRSALGYGALAVLVLVFWIASARSTQHPAPQASLGLQVSLPLFVQIALAGGDRFAAANVGVFRALVAASENQDDAGLAVQAAIQRDVSQLNPGHEDNYYLAAASLTGTALHEAGQQVLRRAIDARPFDFVPPFFYGVHRMHYDADPLEGAKWMQVAALRAKNETDRIGLEKTAVRWIQKGQDPAMAAAVLDAMAKEARNNTLRQYITKRAQQARGLLELVTASSRYEAQKGRKPAALEDLLRSGVLRQLPEDPLGVGYEIGADGKPAIRHKQPAGAAANQAGGVK